MSGNERRPTFRPLRGLAQLLSAGMALIVAGICARAAVELAGMGDSGPRPQSDSGHGLDAFIDLAIFAWSIAFLVWLWRARANAEMLGYRQRRARGWTFWGWVIPIVNLWFPFQIMSDIWRAGLPPTQRQRRAWLVAAWWTAWLLSGFSVSVDSAGHETKARGASIGVPLPHIGASSPAISIGFTVLAGLLVKALIRNVSRGAVGAPPTVAGPGGAEPWTQPWPLPT